VATTSINTLSFRHVFPNAVVEFRFLDLKLGSGPETALFALQGAREGARVGRALMP
jgi:hypothetical protein